MLKILSAVAVVGFLIGFAAYPVFAESPESQAGQGLGTDRDVAQAQALGGELGGRDFGPTEDEEVARDPAPGVRSVSASARNCTTVGSCVANPEQARRVLGALLASMGRHEASRTTVADALTPGR
jgi:hypothetical protein